MCCNFREKFENSKRPCFAIFAKNSKIQNGLHFGVTNFFLKIGMATLRRFPVDQKFRQNRSV